MKPTGTFDPPELHTEIVKCDECCGATFGSVDGLCHRCHDEHCQRRRKEELRGCWWYWWADMAAWCTVAAIVFAVVLTVVLFIATRITQ